MEKNEEDINNKDEKFTEVEITSHINEIMSQTEIIQHFKNTSKNPIELTMTLPKLSNCTITRFEMSLDNKKVVSRILEKEKAKEKYSDSITTGNYNFISYNEDNKSTVSLGNIPPNKEIELKTYYIGNLICNDLSYETTIPVIFPKFIIEDPKNEILPQNENEFIKKKVKGKIYINAFSKITRLIINGSSNFDKIEKKYSNENKSAEINILKKTFSDKDIPGVVIFRTEKINDDILYTQYDPIKDLNYCLVQTTEVIPEIKSLNDIDIIDQKEDVKYSSLIQNDESMENNIGCYLFLIDQSGSMSGSSIELCSKSLLLFLQSLNKGSYFQLIGFGSNFSYYSDEPLEYNKENVKKLFETIKNLKADKGGTNLYKPLNDIYGKSIYDKYQMAKHIFLLTDGEIDDKESTLNLIASNSDRFSVHSLGIGGCDLDLIKRSAIMGKGNSFIIQNLNNLNQTVINALEGAHKNKEYNFENNYSNNKDKIYLECNKTQFAGINDFIRYGFILKDKNIDDIEIKMKKGYKHEEKIMNFNKSNNSIKTLPDGNKLGKIIAYNYFRDNKNILKEEGIKLSKEFGILSDYTAFYAEIESEETITEKMVTYTNDNKQALNNNSKIGENDFEIKEFGYDEDVNNKPKKKSGNFFTNLFRNKDTIIKKKNIKYKEPFDFSSLIPHFSFSSSKIRHLLMVNSASLDFCCKESNVNYLNDCYYLSAEPDENDFSEFSKSEEGLQSKPLFNFDEMILSQDIFDGNWSMNDNLKILIGEENSIYEKIKKYCEEKGIKEENGIITLFVLYYIYNKKIEKVNELKFVINKAKVFIKNIFGLDYDTISKEII